MWLKAVGPVRVTCEAHPQHLLGMGEPRRHSGRPPTHTHSFPDPKSIPFVLLMILVMTTILKTTVVFIEKPIISLTKTGSKCTSAVSLLNTTA